MNILARAVAIICRRNSAQFSSNLTRNYSRIPYQISASHKSGVAASSCLHLSFSRKFSDTHATPPPPFPDDSPPKNEGSAEKESDSSQSSASASQNEEEEPKVIKEDRIRVLDAALYHVPTLGWTEEAMVAGAKEVGLSPAIVGIFPRKEAALVEHFMDECLNKLVEEVDSRAEELSNLALNERLRKIIRMRLQMQIPYISKWAQALSIQANPINVPTSFKQRALLMDEIWHAAGDRSLDLDWYVKRTLLGGIYAATELYMLTDYSPDYKDTWAFLDNRIRDALDCRKTVHEAAQVAAAVGAGIGNTVQSFLRRQSS